MISETLIRLSQDNLVEIESIDDDNTKIIKHITFDELVDLLKSSRASEEKSKSFSTQVLPYNEMSGIHTIASKIYEDGSQIVFLYRKPQKTCIRYYDTNFNNTGVPGLIFGIKYTMHRIRAVYIVAVDDSVITNTTPIYYYPFSNVSAFDQRVCFGRNNIFDIEYKEPALLHSIPSMFLAMPNNDDSYGNNLSSLAHRKLLEELDNIDYPKQWLKPIFKTDAIPMTIGDWIEKISY